MDNKENTGAIFKNMHKKDEKHPDYKGTINVDGKEKQIALWVKTSAKGTMYMSAAISEPYVPEGNPVAEDDLPF